MGRSYTANKAVVVGAVQRDGDVRLKVIKNRNRRDIEEFISTHSSPDAMMFTDDYGVYDYLPIHRHQEVNRRVGPRRR